MFEEKKNDEFNFSVKLMFKLIRLDYVRLMVTNAIVLNNIFSFKSSNIVIKNYIFEFNSITTVLNSDI